MVGVDSIVGASADQAEGDDVPVSIEVVRDGLIELDRVRIYEITCNMRGNIPQWVAY